MLMTENLEVREKLKTNEKFFFVVTMRSGNKLTQKDNADSGVQFITLAGPRQSLLSESRPLDQFCENLVYPKCIRFPETSLNKGKRKIQSKLTMIKCLKPRQLTVDNYQSASGHIPISIIDCIILFGYTDS